VFVTLTNVGAVAVGTLTVMHVREALHRIERQLLVYAWQLREFVPIAARAATDPTTRRQTAKSG
jgi:hypothetical protein